jgi:hypothetical protein
MARKIDTYEVVIDSRDIVARIDELLAEQDGWQEADEQCSWANHDPDAAQELEQLQGWYRQLCDVGGDTPEDGMTLVRESYFVDYAQEFWEDTRDHDIDVPTWPYSHIDWQRAADNLQVDYTSVDLGGVTYYVR